MERRWIAVVLSVEKKTNKALSGKQKKLDRNKNGKIDGGDFAMLRNEKTRKAIKSDAQIEKEILAEIKKEGGALGMKKPKSNISS